MAKNLDEFQPEAVEILLGFAFADVVEREGIPLKTHNHVTAVPVRATLCNAHERRQFVDVINPFPDEVAWVIKQYGEI